MDIDKELIKPYLLDILNRKEKEKVYEKAITHQKKIDRGIIKRLLSLLIWVLSLLPSLAIINYLSLIGLGIVILVYVGYFIDLKEEKVFWRFITSNGRIALEESKKYFI